MEQRRRRPNVAERPQPQRTCVACRTVRPKRELVRVVRAPDGTLSIDLRGKTPGRGAYVCPLIACLDRGMHEGAVARALEVTIDEATRASLREQLGGAAVARVMAVR